MNRLVYLFSLDSVCRCEGDEGNVPLLTKGVREMFRQIVHCGNSVAISMNQLVDSRFFAQAVRSDETYPQICRLFETGALRVSLYGSVRTPSQYVQQAAEKCLQGGRDAFRFSNLPVEPEETQLLTCIRDALRFSDRKRVEQLRDEAEGEEWERLDGIARFVSIILSLSTSPLAMNPPKAQPGRGFLWFMDTLKRLLLHYDFKDAEKSWEMQAAVRELDELETKIVKDKTNRSNWLEFSMSPLAEKLVNLCYNYTVEDSVSGVCKRYDEERFEESFLQDLLRRLEEEEEQGRPRRVPARLWKSALRVAEHREGIPLAPGGEWKREIVEERGKWRGFMLGKTLSSLAWALGYIGLFVGIEHGMNCAEGQLCLPVENGLLSTVLSILLLGLFGSLLGLILKKINRDHEIPDLLESIREIFVHLYDFGVVLLGGKEK